MHKNDRKTHLFIALLGILVALAALSGCDVLPAEEVVTATLTATQTETATATIDWFPVTQTPTLPPIPSPTPQPTLIDMREGITERLVDDDFSNERLWETRQSSFGNIAFGVNNLTLAVARPNTSLVSFSQHNLAEDFYLEMTIQTTLCSPADQTGLLFWQQSESNYYRLLINCAGQVRLELIQNGQTIVVQDWESAQRVQPGAPGTNRVGLYVTRGLFQLYINDAYQFERRIALDRSGGLGVLARTISGDAMTVRFSDLQIYRTDSD